MALAILSLIAILIVLAGAVRAAALIAAHAWRSVTDRDRL